jgi:hypothetical protein
VARKGHLLLYFSKEFGPEEEKIPLVNCEITGREAMGSIQ